MAWLDDAWNYRTPLTFANHSGATEIDGTITMPKAMGKFWENVQTDFDDVRITAADGVTLLSYGFNTSTGPTSVADRRCTIEIDGYDVGAHIGNEAVSASVGGFLYWGNTAASAAATSVTITSAKTVHVNLSSPLGTSTVFNLKCQAVGLNQQYYTHEIRKTSVTQTIMYWDVSSCVLRLARSNQKSNRNEEIAYVDALILDQDGVDTTSSMTVLNSMVICDDYIVSMPIKAGDHEKRYNVIMTFGLIDEAGGVRVFDQRATLHVQNPSLHPAI